MSANSRDPASPSRSGEGDAHAERSVHRCFLFTDIERSTEYWERFGESFRECLDLHHKTVRAVLREHGGQELTEAGDGFLLAFPTSDDALRCAVALQTRLEALEWPPPIGPLAVRIGIHAGEVEPRENGEYRGLVLNRAARIRDTAHGGQIVCSSAVAEHVPAPLHVSELGTFRLRGLPAPERLFQVCWNTMPRRDFPPLRAVPAYRHNLPSNLSRFIGREAQISKVRISLPPARGPAPKRSSRLVTLTGPGGTGKTRLALAVAESLLEDYSHAAWFVPLADIDDVLLIPSVIREALRIDPEPAKTALEQVIAFLGEEPALFVLDNFEQLAEGGAGVIEQLLARVPNLRLLVTSRHRLHLPLEREIQVPPLEVPGALTEPEEMAEVESVALFADRATHANSAFELTETNTAAVAELCTRLEGVPLAIELAAARSAVRTPREILRELGQRLDAFASSDPAAPARHRSLRAAVAWSFDYLPEPLQHFLANLSVFRGGWTAQAAEAVAAPAHLPEVSSHVLRSLSELRGLSLVSSEEAHDTMRFRLLETIRQFASERVPESARPELEERHLLFFKDLAARFYKGALTPEQPAWLERLALDLDNLRAAMRSSADPRPALQIAIDMAIFWLVRARGEEARETLTQLRAKCADHESIATASADTLLGILDLGEERLTTAEEHFQRALEYFRRVDDKKNICALQVNLGIVMTKRRDYEGALASYHSVLPLARELGPAAQLPSFLANLGAVKWALKDYLGAREVLDESAQLLAASGETRVLATVLRSLSLVYRDQGDVDRAEEYLNRAITLHREIRDRSTLPTLLFLTGGIASRRDRAALAAHFFFAAEQAREEIGAGDVTISREENREEWARVEAQLSAEQMAEARTAGAALFREWLRALA